MRDPRPLVHAGASGHEVFLVLIHEFGPAFEHQNDVEFGLMLAPSGAVFRVLIRFRQLRDDPSAGGGGDAEVAIHKGIAQTVASPWCVARFHMGEFIGPRFFQHGQASSFGPLTGAGVRRGPGCRNQTCLPDEFHVSSGHLGCPGR